VLQRIEVAVAAVIERDQFAIQLQVATKGAHGFVSQPALHPPQITPTVQPASAETERGVAVDIDVDATDADGDPVQLVLTTPPESGEVELLDAFGMSAVLAAAAPADGGSWLVEIYADGSPDPLEQVEPTVRVLVAEAVRRRISLQTLRSESRRLSA